MRHPGPTGQLHPVPRRTSDRQRQRPQNIRRLHRRHRKHSSASFHGNNIQKGAVGSVEILYYTFPDQGIDFTGNWWGTTDPDSIAAWIHDVHDDPELQAEIIFDPFADGPVSEEGKSFGDLKSMFR